MAYKTVNGKLVKTTAVRSINEQALTKVLEKMAYILIEENPEVGYDSDDNMRSAADATILSYNLKTRELQDLLVYREKFEAVMDKTYNIDRGTGLSSMMQDLGAHYKEQGVSQIEQVMSGLLDSMIGALFMASQEAA
jgi:hypothetical protein